MQSWFWYIVFVDDLLYANSNKSPSPTAMFPYPGMPLRNAAGMEVNKLTLWSVSHPDGMDEPDAALVLLLFAMDDRIFVALSRSSARAYFDRCDPSQFSKIRLMMNRRLSSLAGPKRDAICHNGLVSQ